MRQALYDCEGEGEEELSFKEGDIIVVVSEKGEWLVAEGGKRFPANYVKML